LDELMELFMIAKKKCKEKEKERETRCEQTKNSYIFHNAKVMQARNIYNKRKKKLTNRKEN